MEGAVVSKAEYAKQRGISAGRLSQYFSEGKLTGEALEGEGRFAKIRVDVANRQLGFLDPVQRIVQKKTPMAPVSNDSFATPESDDQRRLLQAKAEQEEIKARNAKRQELVSQGIYVLSEEVQRAFGATWAKHLRELEQWLTIEIAPILASKFSADVKIVSIALKDEWRKFRARRAEEALKGAAAESELSDEPDTKAE